MYSKHGLRDCHLLKRAEGVLMRGTGEAVIQGDGKPIALLPGVPAPRLSDLGLFACLSLLPLLLPLHMQHHVDLHSLKRHLAVALRNSDSHKTHAL